MKKCNKFKCVWDEGSGEWNCPEDNQPCWKGCNVLWGHIQCIMCRIVKKIEEYLQENFGKNFVSSNDITIIGWV